MKFRREKIEDMSSGALLEEGSKAFQKNDWKKAAKYLIPYVEKHPTDIKAKKILARVLLALNRPNDAAAIYESLQHQNPDNAHAIGMRGMALVGAGEKDSGISELKRSLQLEDSSEFRGSLYKAQGKDIKILSFEKPGARHGVGPGVVVETLLINYLESIAIHCIAYKAMINASELLEAIRMNEEELKKILSSVEKSTNSKASFVQLDDFLALEFRKQ